MIDPLAKLSVSRQAIVLGISRGSVYSQPRPVSDPDLKLMHRIDRLHMEFPFAGSRMLQGLLVQEGFKVGRLHVATLMKRMGIEALYRKPLAIVFGPMADKARPQNRHRGTRSTPTCSGSCRSPGPTKSGRWTSPIFPWRGASSISAPFWTGLPDACCPGGCRSRPLSVIASNHLPVSGKADFCIEAVEEALARYGNPEIFNTDQGSQFTSTDFIKVLPSREIKISMPLSDALHHLPIIDGKGAWRDNVFPLGDALHRLPAMVERLWRTIKYKEVYLHAYASVSEARASIGRYLGFYNSRRPHSSLDSKTPDQTYSNQPVPDSVAA